MNTTDVTLKLNHTAMLPEYGLMRRVIHVIPCPCDRCEGVRASAVLRDAIRRAFVALVGIHFLLALYRAESAIRRTRNGVRWLRALLARCEADRSGEPTACDLRVLRCLDVAVKVLLVAIATGFFAVVVHAVLSGAVERLAAR